MEKTLIIALLTTLCSPLLLASQESSVQISKLESSHIIKTNSKKTSSSVASLTKKNSQSVYVDDSLKCEINSPCFIVKDTSEQVLNSINNGANPKQTNNLIKNIVTPQFNFAIMTKLAMGSNWKLATDKQQEELVENFKNLLIFTYSSTLSKFRGATITITNQNINEKKAYITTKVVLPNSTNNSQPIKVEYDLVQISEDAPWQAYDIKIENASLVTTYRNQFNNIVQTNKIDGLITQLKSKVIALQKSK